jgi:hypothetical protein
MRSEPSWLARVVLTHLVRNEALTGDLLEAYRGSPSRPWLWRQILIALVVGMRHPRACAAAQPAGIFALDPHWQPSGSRYEPMPPVAINMSGIPVDGVGGLGLVAIAVLISFVMPAAWWLLVCGVIGGAVIGGYLVFSRRDAGLTSGGARPGGLFGEREGAARHPGPAQQDMHGPSSRACLPSAAHG